MTNKWEVEWYRFDGFQFIGFDDWYSFNSQYKESEAVRYYELEKHKRYQEFANRREDLQTQYSMDVARESYALQCDLIDIETDHRQEVLKHAIQSK